MHSMLNWRNIEQKDQRNWYIDPLAGCFHQLRMKYEGGVDRHKILRQKSYHFARFLHLPVKYVTFHITWVATFLHRKIRYIKLFITLFGCQIFFLSSAKTSLVQEIYLFWTGSSGWCNFCAKLYEKDIFSICSLKEMDEVRLMKAF